MYIILAIVLCFHASATVNGKFISPDLGIGGGYKYTSHIGPEAPVELSYHHGAVGAPFGGYEAGAIGGYGGPIGGPVGIYEPGKALGYEGALGVPQAAGLGYGFGPGIGPHVEPSYGHRRLGGYGPGIGYGGYKGDIVLPAGHAGYVHPSGVYPNTAGLGNIGYGYGHNPHITHGLHHGIGLEHGFGHKELGESELEKSVYNDGKKNLVGEHFVKSHGEHGDTVAHGDSGYTADKVAVKDVKGDSVHFIDSDGGKKAHHNGKEYQGGQHFDKEGKSGSENHEKQGHRKGHNIKGFKKSHHLDETGKTEEYFDEVHDEGGNYAFDGHTGKFGESGGSSFKGGVQDGKYSAGENKKEGYVDSEYVVDKEHAGSGKFGGNKFSNNKEVYGLNKELGAHDSSGHHEYNNEFKKYPYYH